MLQDGKSFYKMISAEGYVPDENFYRQIFARCLLDLRFERNLSRKEVAKGAGVSESFIAECERANRTPKLEHIFKLSKFFQVSIDDLTGHELENCRDVLKYRFDRALVLTEEAGNMIDYPDDGGCALIIFADKDAKDKDDANNCVIEFETNEGCAIFIETVVERAIHDGATFDDTARKIIDWWNTEGKARFEAKED